MATPKSKGPTTRAARKLRKVITSSGAQADFPELVRTHARCTLCALIADHPDLLKEIHYMTKQRIGTRRIAVLIEPELQERGLRLIDFRAIGRHQKGHLSRNLIVDPTQELPVFEEEPPPPPPPPLPLPKKAATKKTSRKKAAREGPAAASYVEQRAPSTDDEADYFELRKLFDRLLPMLDLANRDLTRKAQDDRGLTAADYKVILAMYSECRQQLEGLNKMRNSNRLTRAVIEAHTSQVLTMLSEPLGQKLRDIRRQLEHNDPTAAIAMLASLIDSDLPPMLVSTGKEAIRRSVDEYKLH